MRSPNFRVVHEVLANQLIVILNNLSLIVKMIKI
jgi:hypothetical protein